MKHLFSLLFALAVCNVPSLAAGKHMFAVGDSTFLQDGKPFVVKAAELHYPRIPRAYWSHRIKMCKALGMNTLCLYVFWNYHEPQPDHYDFTGNADLRAFIKLAAKEGMYVILRPGPYVCAEWEMGGLPWWLLKKKDIRLREQDPYFMERLGRFERRVAAEVSDLTSDKGGPIIMVQVENEYGSYGTDKPYVSAVRDTLRAAGFDKVPLFQCDWSSNFTHNGLPDLLWTMNFGTGARVEHEFARLKELRPTSPLMCSEYWSGWFDKWGARHETRGAEAMVDGIGQMLDNGISFSLYMTHGGTNFGHWAGANSPGFAPDVTSYDYDAPINEAGRPTEKYYQLRECMRAHLPQGATLPQPPAALPVMTLPKVKFEEYAPLFENLPAGVHTTGIKPMENFDQGWGSILYQTELPQDFPAAILRVTEPHDYLQVFVDGVKIGIIDRRLHENEIALPALQKGARLTLFVEAMGRINFGRAIKDYKGITEKVELLASLPDALLTLQPNNWTVYLLPDAYEDVAAMKWRKYDGETGTPGCYRATFRLNKTADTFLSLETWGKGQVYVNGHALGRFWQIGPQQTLYLPGCFLHKGKNEIIVADVVGPEEAAVEGFENPILDRLHLSQSTLHRKASQTLNLTDFTQIYSGVLSSGNGWQEVHFDTPATGRYVCLVADDIYNKSGQRVIKGQCALSEFYLLDDEGKRLDREGWQVVYADSEAVTQGNHTADKAFDLQESTYWATTSKEAFPHSLVIDLGESHTVNALQCLPRMEAGAPGAIASFRLFISDSLPASLQ